MKLAKYILAGILIILESSCSKVKNYEFLLAGDDYKYWLFKNQDERSHTNIIYYFDRTGKWIVFNRNENGRFYKYNASDIVLIENWRFINDSVIEIGGASYAIIALDESSFKYVDAKQGVRSLEIVPDSLIPSNFRKTYSEEN